jgi:hypothetical protein
MFSSQDSAELCPSLETPAKAAWAISSSLKSRFIAIIEAKSAEIHRRLGDMPGAPLLALFEKGPYPTADP